METINLTKLEVVGLRALLSQRQQIQQEVTRLLSAMSDIEEQATQALAGKIPEDATLDDLQPTKDGGIAFARRSDMMKNALRAIPNGGELPATGGE